MKLGSKRNDRKRRILIVERLEVRALLSASRAGFSVEMDNGYESPRDLEFERFASNDLEVRGALDGALNGERGGRFEGFKRLESTQSADSGTGATKYSELNHRTASERSPVLAARDANADVPAQIRNSGRGISLDVSSQFGSTAQRGSASDGHALALQSAAPRERFHNGFDQPQRFDRTLGNGLIKAVAERKGAANENRLSNQDDEALGIDTTRRADGFSSIRASQPAVDPTIVHSPAAVFRAVALRVFAPPASFSAIASAQASDRLSGSNAVGSSINVRDSLGVDSQTSAEASQRVSSPVATVPTSLSPVLVSSGAEAGIQDAFGVGSAFNVGAGVNQSAAVRSSRAPRLQENASDLALRILTQMEAVRNSVSSTVVESATPFSSSVDASQAAQALGVTANSPRNGSSNSNADAVGGFVELAPGVADGLGATAETPFSEQSIDQLFADSDSFDSQDASSSLSGLPSLGVADGLDAIDEGDAQIGSMLAGDSSGFTEGQLLNRGDTAESSYRLGASTEGSGGFIDLQSSLRSDAKSAPANSTLDSTESSGESRRSVRDDQGHEIDEPDVDKQWVTEQENAEFGGFVELADGTEQGDQWLAMNLDSPDSATLAAYDPASIEATAGVFRSFELVGMQPVGVPVGSIVDEFVADEFLMYEETVSLGDYFGTPLRRAMVGIPAAMVLSAYLVRQRVSEDDEVLMNTRQRPVGSVNRR